MVIRINPNHQAVWRSPYAMQLGTAAGSPVLNNLTAAQERLIAALYQGIADQQLPAISKQLKLADEEVEAVLDQVGSVLTLEPPENKTKTKLSAEFVASAFSEIIRASLTSGSDGEAVLLSRSARYVHLDSLDAAGLSVALGLAAAGIGHLVVADDSTVTRADVGPVGYPSQFLGHYKIDSLRSLLAASPNHLEVLNASKLSDRQLQKVDSAILISQQVTLPDRYERWMKRKTPHLVVTFDAESVLISPLILPGITACWYCLEKQRAANDEAWPVIASQLTMSQKKFDDAASQLFAAGLALQKTLSGLDRIGGFDLAPENYLGFMLTTANGNVTEFTWPASGACGCSVG